MFGSGSDSDSDNDGYWVLIGIGVMTRQHNPDRTLAKNLCPGAYLEILQSMFEKSLAKPLPPRVHEKHFLLIYKMILKGYNTLL
ncbi:MAG: hypothetical protein B6245_16740 [Desulfobacteraceae bacterium 4572_88]|nr:MAG: hypothetical protein B6245_16740 [Desulfobacteraceae bacterium 4572_88]